MLTATLLLTNLWNDIVCITQEILSTKNVAVPELYEEVRFSDIAISSLDLAEMVSSLEAKYDVDPFESETSITDIVTLGDLCQAFHRSLATSC